MQTLTVTDAYERVGSDGVVVHRPDRGLIHLTGPQRIWFLENTVTNVVEGTEPGRWVESCFLEIKGHVIAHFRVGVLDEELWLDVDPPGTGPLVDWMTRYRFRTKVEIEDRSIGAYTICGPPARDLVGDGEVRVAGDRVLFGGTMGGVPTADVHAPEAPEGIAPAPEELYEILRTEAGEGRFGVDYGPGELAQEAGLSRVVRADKGCYVGQEVVARLHFRGKVNKVLRPLAFDGDPDPEALAGRDLTVDGQKVGTVTSAVRSPGRGTIGIGMVRVVVEEGASVDVADHGTARVGPIPEGTKVKKG